LPPAGVRPVRGQELQAAARRRDQLFKEIEPSGKRAFRARQRLEMRVTAAGFVGKVVRYDLKKDKILLSWVGRQVAARPLLIYGSCATLCRMPHEISVRQLRDHTADVLRRVEAGESFRVTVDRRPVAELVPLPSRATWVKRQRVIDSLVQADPALGVQLARHRRRAAMTCR
jgi:prevent-host-death family protein